jgi:hypothetical protein
MLMTRKVTSAIEKRGPKRKDRGQRAEVEGSRSRIIYTKRGAGSLSSPFERGGNKQNIIQLVA